MARGDDVRVEGRPIDCGAAVNTTMPPSPPYTTATHCYTVLIRFGRYPASPKASAFTVGCSGIALIHPDLATSVHCISRFLVNVL